MIDLRCADALAVVDSLPDGSVAFIHADPPWTYSNNSDTWESSIPYAGLPDAIIAQHLAATNRLVPDGSYLACWCTFPKLWEWARQDAIMQQAGWAYVSGGAWGKTNGLGPGTHFRGDSELLLLYKKGSPRPLDGSKSNLWLAHRQIHSEKPQTALRALVRMAAPVGGLVLDLYAGESASLARACRALGRAYIGAELDPARHALAVRRLSQQEMLWDVA